MKFIIITLPKISNENITDIRYEIFGAELIDDNFKLLKNEYTADLTKGDIIEFTTNKGIIR